MPKPNYVLLKQLICVLQKIKAASTNQLDTFDLSVRIAPHVLWNPTCKTLFGRDLSKKVRGLIFPVETKYSLYFRNLEYLRKITDIRGHRRIAFFWCGRYTVLFQEGLGKGIFNVVWCNWIISFWFFPFFSFPLKLLILDIDVLTSNIMACIVVVQGDYSEVEKISWLPSILFVFYCRHTLEHMILVFLFCSFF